MYSLRSLTQGTIRLVRESNGGAGGNRTPDLDIANVALSQLSYGPGDANSAPSHSERKAHGPHRGSAACILITVASVGDD